MGEKKRTVARFRPGRGYMATAVATPPNTNACRSPIHPNPEKGQVYGGECNITRCDRRGATWWNMGTYALYCRSCAAGINFRRDRPALCVEVAEKPLLEDHERFKDEHGYYEAIR